MPVELYALVARGEAGEEFAWLEFVAAVAAFGGAAGSDGIGDDEVAEVGEGMADGGHFPAELV